MREYQFDLPFPPTLNTYRAVARNRLITSKKGRKYKKDVALKMSELNLSGEMLDCRLSIYIRMHPPCKTKRDLDNYLKAVIDALTDCEFWQDDEQIDRLCISRGEKIKGGKLIITVKELESEL